VVEHWSRHGSLGKPILKHPISFPSVQYFWIFLHTCASEKYQRSPATVAQRIAQLAVVAALQIVPSTWTGTLAK
jgi:hypothetical protein